MYEIQLKHHRYRRSYFIFQTVHLKAVAFEDHFSARSLRYPLDDWLKLSGIETLLRYHDIERQRQKPNGSDVEFAGLPLANGPIETHQSHYGPYCPLNVDPMIPKYSNQARLRAH